jgi:hypothetical protein
MMSPTFRPNPFKPTAGGNPPRIIGRDGVRRDFEKAIVNGVGAPGRIMLLTGARGTGKTVMLASIASVARSYGWEVLTETGSDGLCVRLVDALTPRQGLLDKLVIKPEVSILGVGGSLGEAELSRKTMPLTLRQALSARITTLQKKGAGLLLAIDEAQAASRDDMVAISTAVQHLVSEGRDVAVVFAGLPSLTSDLLNDDVLTFMRRAKREVLVDIPVDEVASSYVETFATAGVPISAELARRAAEATYGYPYMVQLVGYNVWDVAEGAPEIAEEHVAAGIEQATADLDVAVCEPELAGLSPMCRAYLEALATLEGPASTGDVARPSAKRPSTPTPTAAACSTRTCSLSRGAA